MGWRIIVAGGENHVRCEVSRVQSSTTSEGEKALDDGEQPYSKICKACCQIGKEKTEEHKAKLSASVKAAQTEELLQRKSEYRKEHPEVWQDQLVPGAGAGWNKGLTLPSRSEETKQKISESVKATKAKKENDNES